MQEAHRKMRSSKEREREREREERRRAVAESARRRKYCRTVDRQRVSACSDSRSVGPKCPSVDLLIGRDWARWRAPAPHAGGRKARREVVTKQGGAWSTAARVILHS